MSELTVYRQQVVDAVTPWIGASLLNRADEFRHFIARDVDDENDQLDEHVSSCGLFALAIWYSLRVNDELVRRPYENGKAITWLVEIAGNLGAVRYPREHGAPTVGALMHYHSPRPSLDDHVEFCLTVPVGESTAQGQSRLTAMHAGGGRPHCGVGALNGTIWWNMGRPLQAWYDADALLGSTSNVLG